MLHRLHSAKSKPRPRFALMIVHRFAGSVVRCQWSVVKTTTSAILCNGSPANHRFAGSVVRCQSSVVKTRTSAILCNGSPANHRFAGSVVRCQWSVVKTRTSAILCNGSPANHRFAGSVVRCQWSVVKTTTSAILCNGSPANHRFAGSVVRCQWSVVRGPLLRPRHQPFFATDHRQINFLFGAVFALDHISRVQISPAGSVISRRCQHPAGSLRRAVKLAAIPEQPDHQDPGRDRQTQPTGDRRRPRR